MDIHLLLISLLGFLLFEAPTVVFGVETAETLTSGPVEIDQGSAGRSADDRRAQPGVDGVAAAVENAKAPGISDDGTDASAKELEIFRRLFQQKRSQQQSAMKDILDKYNYEQRFKLVQLLFDRMLEILVESKERLAKDGFQPGMPFPTDQGIKEGLSLLFENLAFFGDITLRLPDITHSLYSKKKPLRDSIRWAMTFTKQTGFLDENQWKLIHLMSQELRLTKRDPDYINPFKKVVAPEPVEPKKKTKKPRKKGPRISRAEL